jgi:MFS family permease
MGYVSELWQFYLFFALGSALGLHEIGSLVTTTVVSKWFVRMRGRALGFTTMGHNLGAVLFGPLVAFIIATVGWRAGWSVLGLIIMSVILPPAILLMRRTPEDMGLLPDGGASARPASSDRWQRSHEEPTWKVRDALRNPTVWLLVAALNLANLGVWSMNIHQVAYFTDVGFSLQAASLLFALQHGLAVISKLFWGFLAERISVRFCLMGTFVGRLAGFLILLFGTAPERVYLFTIISGLFGGAITSLQSQIWADYYGRTFLGSIRGTLAPFNLISSLGGPLFTAFVFDVAGSYDGAFWAFVTTLPLGVVLLYFAKPPERK